MVMKMMMGEMLAEVGSAIATVMFVWAIFKDYLPHEYRSNITKYCRKLFSFASPYTQITFHERTGERLSRSEVYTAIETYLSANSSQNARRLKADIYKDSQSPILSMDDDEEVTDEFSGVKLWWVSGVNFVKTPSFSFHPTSEEKRYYKLIFLERHREIITGSYLKHVMEKGNEISVKNRQRKLYTNNPNQSGYRSSAWSHVTFEHPASFETLAMEPKKKKEIVDDLIKFSQSKDYYKKIGKPWKRGYLLYGPPGTGKSTMIAAMANFLNYDVYDVELTAVKDNNGLRKLLIETSSKSIIVIEDIDCSLDLTGQRKEKNEKDEEKEKEPGKKMDKEIEKKSSEVTLSGLLNFIDGLWSACGGERIIVFTTNFVEKLDPALIRRGRMDKHIELSYCRFEAFKVLAKNYLDLESHHLFDRIKLLLEETNMTPADVAENLMYKTLDEDPEVCLEYLIEALENSKKEARLKAEEEERLKAKKEAKEKEIQVEKTENEAKERESESQQKKKQADEVKENGGMT